MGTGRGTGRGGRFLVAEGLAVGRDRNLPGAEHGPHICYHPIILSSRRVNMFMCGCFDVLRCGCGNGLCLRCKSLRVLCRCVSCRRVHLFGERCVLHMGGAVFVIHARCARSAFSLFSASGA